MGKSEEWSDWKRDASGRAYRTDGRVIEYEPTIMLSDGHVLSVRKYEAMLEKEKRESEE
jgi:hypothetical protein